MMDKIFARLIRDIENVLYETIEYDMYSSFDNDQHLNEMATIAKRDVQYKIAIHGPSAGDR